MRYMGVDVGYSRCGWGVIEDRNGDLEIIDSGVIKTPEDWAFPERLSWVKRELIHIIDFKSVDVLGVEHPLHGKNSTNSVEVGAAYGAVLLAGVEMDIPMLILWPTQVKAAVANGRASKAEVLAGVMMILSLATRPAHDDESDALAAAVCARDRWIQAQMIREALL